MTQQELKKLIEAGSIRTITFLLPGTIYAVERPYVWEVWAYGHEHEKIANSFGNLLRTLSGQAKTYTSLDRARRALREMGYTGDFTIQG